jgi:CRP-like cAMP-binding protein
MSAVPQPLGCRQAQRGAGRIADHGHISTPSSFQKRPQQVAHGRHGQRKDAPSYSLRISQERLGMMLSLSRQTVNELLRHLEHKSIIHRRRGGVRILDPGRLRAAARVSS